MKSAMIGLSSLKKLLLVATVILTTAGVVSGRMNRLPFGISGEVQLVMGWFPDRTGRAPLFRACTSRGQLTDRPMSRNDALRAVKRRAVAAGLSHRITCH